MDNESYQMYSSEYPQQEQHYATNEQYYCALNYPQPIDADAFSVTTSNNECGLLPPQDLTYNSESPRVPHPYFTNSVPHPEHVPDHRINVLHKEDNQQQVYQGYCHQPPNWTDSGFPVEAPPFAGVQSDCPTFPGENSNVLTESYFHHGNNQAQETSRHIIGFSDPPTEHEFTVTHNYPPEGRSQIPMEVHRDEFCAPSQQQDSTDYYAPHRDNSQPSVDMHRAEIFLPPPRSQDNSQRPVEMRVEFSAALPQADFSVISSQDSGQHLTDLHQIQFSAAPPHNTRLLESPSVIHSSKFDRKLVRSNSSGYRSYNEDQSNGSLGQAPVDMHRAEFFLHPPASGGNGQRPMEMLVEFSAALPQADFSVISSQDSGQHLTDLHQIQFSAAPPHNTRLLESPSVIHSSEFDRKLVRSNSSGYRNYNEDQSNGSLGQAPVDMHRAEFFLHPPASGGNGQRPMEMLVEFSAAPPKADFSVFSSQDSGQHQTDLHHIQFAAPPPHNTTPGSSLQSPSAMPFSEFDQKIVLNNSSGYRNYSEDQSNGYLGPTVYPCPPVVKQEFGMQTNGLALPHIAQPPRPIEDLGVQQQYQVHCNYHSNSPDDSYSQSELTRTLDIKPPINEWNVTTGAAASDNRFFHSDSSDTKPEIQENLLRVRSSPILDRRDGSPVRNNKTIKRESSLSPESYALRQISRISPRGSSRSRSLRRSRSRDRRSPFRRSKSRNRRPLSPLRPSQPRDRRSPSRRSKSRDRRPLSPLRPSQSRDRRSPSRRSKSRDRRPLSPLRPSQSRDRRSPSRRSKSRDRRPLSPLRPSQSRDRRSPSRRSKSRDRRPLSPLRPSQSRDRRSPSRRSKSRDRRPLSPLRPSQSRDRRSPSRSTSPRRSLSRNRRSRSSRRSKSIDGRTSSSRQFKSRDLSQKPPKSRHCRSPSPRRSKSADRRTLSRKSKAKDSRSPSPRPSQSKVIRSPSRVGRQSFSRQSKLKDYQSQSACKSQTRDRLPSPRRSLTKNPEPRPGRRSVNSRSPPRLSQSKRCSPLALSRRSKSVERQSPSRHLKSRDSRSPSARRSNSLDRQSKSSNKQPSQSKDCQHLPSKRSDSVDRMRQSWVSRWSKKEDLLCTVGQSKTRDMPPPSPRPFQSKESRSPSPRRSPSYIRPVKRSASVDKSSSSQSNSRLQRPISPKTRDRRSVRPKSKDRWSPSSERPRGRGHKLNSPERSKSVAGSRTAKKRDRSVTPQLREGNSKGTRRDELIEKWRRLYCKTDEDFEQRLKAIAAMNSDEILQEESRYWARSAALHPYYQRNPKVINLVEGTSTLGALIEQFHELLIKRPQDLRAEGAHRVPPVPPRRLQKCNHHGDCSSSSDDEEIDCKENEIMEELDRKLRHPFRLHRELWHNELGEMNDGPLCKCSMKARRSGIRHGLYAGETDDKFSCDNNKNNPEKLYHYRITISPPTNFLSRTPTIINYDGHEYIFEGFSLLSHYKLPVLPVCKVIRFNIEYMILYIEEPFLENFIIRECDLFFEYLFKEILELLDLDLYATNSGNCPIFHFMPRFVRELPEKGKELLPMCVVLKYLMTSYKPLVPEELLSDVAKTSESRWLDFADEVKGMIVTKPGMKPSSLRVDQLDKNVDELPVKTKLQKEEGECSDSSTSLKSKDSSSEGKKAVPYPVIVHFGIRPPQLSYAGNPEYQKAWQDYIKHSHLIANLAKPTIEEKRKLAEKEAALQRMRTKGNMKRDITVTVSSKGFYRTGLMCDVVQHAMLIPVLTCHLRFHRSLNILEKTLGYEFKNRHLLQLALTHPSYRENFGTNPDHARNSLTNCGIRQPEYGDRRIHFMSTKKSGINTLIKIMSRFGCKSEKESSVCHNERLEFLGDAVVEFVSTIHLFFIFRDLEEGGLATYRAALVQNQHLALLAQNLNLDAFLLYAHGSDLCHDLELKHALANCFEALMGALFLDGGIDVPDRVFGMTLYGDSPVLHDVWTNYPPHVLQEQEPEGDRHWIDKVTYLKKLTEFEDKSGTVFNHIRLLARSLTDRSVGYTNLTLGSNQRLEFLGDSVLQLVVSEYLYKHFPDHHEGHLSLLRSSLVNNKTQSVVCDDLGLTEYASYAAVKTEVKVKDKADLLEAFLGALYVDKRDLDYLRVFCNVCFFPRLREFIMNQEWNDPKSKLQQCCLTLRTMDGGEPDIPRYKVIECKGPTNARSYTIAVYFRGERLGKASGRSIQEAEMNAASVAIDSCGDLFPQLDHQKRVVANTVWRRRKTQRNVSKPQSKTSEARNDKRSVRKTRFSTPESTDKT